MPMRLNALALRYATSAMNIRIVTNALQSYSTRSPYVQPPSDNTSQSKYVLEHILRSSHLHSGAEHGSATIPPMSLFSDFFDTL
jgi:hypothetical protein